MSIKKHIPNTITLMNLLCGVLGVIMCFSGKLGCAFYLMLLAAVADFCDGLSARALGAYSPLGKELDSLSDLVSFGVLPSIMLFCLRSELSGGRDLICYIPLAIALFSSLRLAKFNLDERQSDNFIGLATPASAIICGSLVHYVTNEGDTFLKLWCEGYIFYPVLTIVLCALMVSEFPMFSMKFKKGANKGTPVYKLRIAFAGIMVASAIFTVLLGLNWAMMPLLSFVAYIILNLVAFK